MIQTEPAMCLRPAKQIRTCCFSSNGFEFPNSPAVMNFPAKRGYKAYQGNSHRNDVIIDIPSVCFGHVEVYKNMACHLVYIYRHEEAPFFFNLFIIPGFPVFQVGSTIYTLPYHGNMAQVELPRLNDVRMVCNKCPPWVCTTSPKRGLLPRKLTWLLKITCLKRKIIFETSILGFHVSLLEGTYCKFIVFIHLFSEFKGDIQESLQNAETFLSIKIDS